MVFIRVLCINKIFYLHQKKRIAPVGFEPTESLENHILSVAP